MKRPLMAALILLVAAASHAEDVAATMKAAYAAMDRAAAKKDVPSMMRYFADDFTYKPKNGPAMSRQQAQQQLEGQFKMAKKLVPRSTVQSVKVSGNQAVVSADQVVRIVVANPQAKKDVTIDVSSQTRDTWVKSGATWKLKKIETVKETMKIDGKTMPEPGAPIKR